MFTGYSIAALCERPRVLRRQRERDGVLVGQVAELRQRQPRRSIVREHREPVLVLVGGDRVALAELLEITDLLDREGRDLAADERDAEREGRVPEGVAQGAGRPQAAAR